MVVITVAISILNISVYADDTVLGGSENGGGGSGGNRDVVALNEFETAFAETTQKYVDGDITYTEWNEQQNALLEDFYSKNTSASGGVIAPAYAIGKRFEGFAKKIGETVSTFGDDARQRVADWWNGVTSDVPTETVQTPTTDYMGYGALCTSIVNSNYSYATACDYILVEFSEDGNTAYLTFYNKDGSLTDNIHMENGSSTISEGLRSGTRISVPYVDGEFIESNGNHIKLSGDVRYIDGTQFPTGEEFEIVTTKKFDEIPAPNLDDLLNDFAEELERQMPDLSTIEGLLKAIYARMGKLDSDNDNQLLSQILSAIKAIKSVDTDVDTDNSELLEILEDIKNSLVYNDGENIETVSEQLKKIIDNQIIRDDFEIDEDLYNNHGEVLKERLLGKFSFIYNMKKFVTYCFDQYCNTSENIEFNIEYDGNFHSINLNVFNEYLPTIQWILAAFIYLTYAYHTYRKIPSYINGGDNE